MNGKNNGSYPKQWVKICFLFFFFCFSFFLKREGKLKFIFFSLEGMMEFLTFSERKFSRSKCQRHNSNMIFTFPMKRNTRLKIFVHLFSPKTECFHKKQNVSTDRERLSHGRKFWGIEEKCRFVKRRAEEGIFSQIWLTWHRMLLLLTCQQSDVDKRRERFLSFFFPTKIWCGSHYEPFIIK